jgi:sugar phosphate permease
MFGGLGAMASTVPIDMLLPALGWRGVFLLLSVATLATAAMILVAAPENRPAANPEDWRSNLRSFGAIYRDPAFWRLAPLSASVIGTAFAVHGLWAARWLAAVDQLGPKQVASDLLVMGAGLTLGAGIIGLLTDRLRHFGLRPTVTFGLGCSLFMILQVASLDRVPLPDWMLWGAFAGFGGMTVVSYSIMGELFPPEKIGRANAALNVLHLATAFVLQYAMGVIASLWQPDTMGHLPVVAYRAAFALPLLLELLAGAWFAVSLTSRPQHQALRAKEVS